MRNQWMRILTVSAACGLSAAAIAETPQAGQKPGQTPTGQTTFRQSDWQKLGTPSQAADMFKGEKHSLVNGIQAAERAVGGNAVRAECRTKTDPTMGGTAGGAREDGTAVGGGTGTGGQGTGARAGAKNMEVVCVVTCLVGDSRFVEVFVDSRGQVVYRDDQGAGVGAASISDDINRAARERIDRERERGTSGTGGSDKPEWTPIPDNSNQNTNPRMSAAFGALGLASADAGDKRSGRCGNGAETSGTLVAGQALTNENHNGMGHHTTVTTTGRDNTTRTNQFAAAKRWHKSADLIGKPVANSADENLGRIEDIVIDANSGRILYGVLSFGGFLGMGEKWFAVPWESLRLQDNSEKLVMNIDKESLKNAEGFDKSNWPDFANQQWATNTYRTYNVQPYWTEQRLAADTGTGQGVTTSSGYRQRWNQAPLKWTKLSDLKGADVLGAENKKVGDLHNSVIDPDGGRVLYAVIDLADADLVAIPWQSIELRCEGEKKDVHKLIVNMTHDQLKSTGTFTSSQYPNLSDRSWSTQTYQKYQVQPYWDGD